MELTRGLLERVREAGIEPVIEPVMNVLVLDVPDVDLVRSKLKDRGWVVSSTRSSTRAPHALRLVIMPHLTQENMNLFADDLCDVVSHG
jgi:tyrosine decarboxylase/aspartate 1-decarboxylase